MSNLKKKPKSRTGARRKKVHFKKALSAVLEATRTGPVKYSWLESEKEAIISHWLNDVTSTPLGMSPAVHRKWIEVLKETAYPNRNLELFDSDDTNTNEVSISFEDVPFVSQTKEKFKFIDLFAGIGGFRLALQHFGGKCVFSSEWDKSAKRTYFENYGEVPFGDIKNFTSTDISERELNRLIPDHDVLAGGFPCQPFSRAGVSARTSLGQEHGFDCSIQGTLFFDIVRIAKAKKPRVLLLENVRNLLSHNQGETFATIKKVITEDLGYSFSYQIIDASTVVPQRRVRCFMVCLRDGEQFDFPDFDGEPLPLSSILEKRPDPKYTISDKLWDGHQKRTQRNLLRGTGFTAFTADLNKPSNTIVARYYKDGKECLIPQKGKNPRKLTPRECARLQGFPEEFLLPEYATPAYKQFGNSVPVPVVKRIAKKVLKLIESNERISR